VVVQEGTPGLRGRLRCRTTYFATVVSLISMPTLSNSPWIWGAPHSGFSRLICGSDRGLRRQLRADPLGHAESSRSRRDEIPGDAKRSRWRGWTMSSAERQSSQTRERNAQNRRSAAVSFGRFLTDRSRTPIWWRTAKCSSSSAERARTIEPSVERKADNRISIR
jgi:hypothetical protein